jgi:hypothetical protein
MLIMLTLLKNIRSNRHKNLRLKLLQDNIYKWMVSLTLKTSKSTIRMQGLIIKPYKQFLDSIWMSLLKN